jgi:hypothetical protein
MLNETDALANVCVASSSVHLDPESIRIARFTLVTVGSEAYSHADY